MMKDIWSYRFHVVSNVLDQLKSKMVQLGIDEVSLAEKLDVPEEWIHTIFSESKESKNDSVPLATLLTLARSIGMKISIVAYDDGDKKGATGVIHPITFKRCWELLGKPHDSFELDKIYAKGTKR